MNFLSPRLHYQTTAEAVQLLGKHRELTWEMTKREISDRYAGQIIGMLWAVGHPLILMGLYVFVFTVVFKTRIGGTVAMPADYTVYLLSGLIPWMAFQEAMAKSSTVMLANANLVKQCVFPIEVLPVKGILASMITQAIATCLLLVYRLIATGTVPWTYVLVPVLWAVQFVAMAGVCYFLATLGAYFRDMKDFIQVFCTTGMYFMPIFYLPDWVPEMVRPCLYFNPFSYLGWCYQDACYFGRLDHPWAWPVVILGSGIVFVLGCTVFRKLKGHFGTVL